METTANVELWGIDGSIVLYGLLCDMMMVVPLVLYLVFEDPNNYAQYHQTTINMFVSAYAPLGITWWIVLADDSENTRTALSGAIEMAGSGPFALLWVGMATYLMTAHSAGELTDTNMAVSGWAFIYPIVNFLLIVMHYHLAPPMYAWLENAPMREKADATPWAMPENWGAKKVVVEETKFVAAGDET